MRLLPGTPYPQFTSVIVTAFRNPELRLPGGIAAWETGNRPCTNQSDFLEKER
jgi:hypothetical protein